MQDVKNSKGKLVCRIDEQARTVEIVQKRRKTIIRFEQDGKAEIINFEEET